MNDRLDESKTLSVFVVNEDFKKMVTTSDEINKIFGEDIINELLTTLGILTIALTPTKKGTLRGNCSFKSSDSIKDIKFPEEIGITRIEFLIKNQKIVEHLEDTGLIDQNFKRHMQLIGDLSITLRLNFKKMIIKQKTKFKTT